MSHVEIVEHFASSIQRQIDDVCRELLALQDRELVLHERKASLERSLRALNGEDQE